MLLERNATEAAVAAASNVKVGMSDTGGGSGVGGGVVGGVGAGKSSTGQG